MNDIITEGAVPNYNGRAYEYAWMETLSGALEEAGIETQIQENRAYEANVRAWDGIDDDKKRLFKASSYAAIGKIIELEPNMTENCVKRLTLEFQQDSAGVDGDVRDILIKRNDIGWETGLSIKHNNEAIKHSRLSRGDFAGEWRIGAPIGAYPRDTSDVFDRLDCDHRQGGLWREIPHKPENIYRPIMEAFIREIKRLYRNDENLPRKLFDYLVGRADYYKVLGFDKKHITMIQTFNISGTLNIPIDGANVGSTVPRVDAPTEIKSIGFRAAKNGAESNNTVDMVMDKDWQFSFRIHSASTKVQSSLKLDVQPVSIPDSVSCYEIRW